MTGTIAPFAVSRSSARSDDAVTRAIKGMVITRGAVTQDQFDAVQALVCAYIGNRFELSAKGAEQAVTPILRTLLHVPTPPKTVVRTLAHRSCERCQKMVRITDLWYDAEDRGVCYGCSVETGVA